MPEVPRVFGLDLFLREDGHCPVSKVQFEPLTRHNGIILAYRRAALPLPETESFVLPPDPGAAP